MPLHLLGKKSWNVYNAANIARVRRDEAAARAAEEAEEERMQEIDAQRRLAILRGELPPPLEKDDYDDDSPHQPRVAKAVGDDASQSIHRRPKPTEYGAVSSGSGSMRKRRKRVGEDDTEFELRLAREKNGNLGHDHYDVGRSRILPATASSASLVDKSGHISLFGDERSRAHAEKNEEAQAEAKKKQRELEDQYTMRFANAAGREGLARPWYSQSDGAAPDASSKDIWGNDDANRRQRDARRIVSDDPLAMMKKGASQVRDLKRERRKIQEERDEDLRELKRGGHRDMRRRRRDESEEVREENRDDERRRSDSRRHEPVRNGRRRRRSRSKDADGRFDKRDFYRDRGRHGEDRHRRSRRSRSRSRSPRRDHHELDRGRR